MANGKHMIWQVVKFATAFGLIAIVISEVNLESVSVLWKRVSMSWFLLSIVAFYGSIWFMARRYWSLIGTQISFKELFHFVIYQTIMGNMITTAVGAAWYVGALRNEGKIRITRSLFSLVAARFGDLVTLLVTLVIATLVVWRHVPTLQVLIIVVISVLTGVALIGVLTLIFRRRVVAFIGQVIDKRNLRGKSFLNRTLHQLTSFLNQEAAQYRQSIGPFSIYSVLILLSMLIFAYSSLQIFGVRIEIWPVVFVVALTQIMSFLPVQVFGGLGIYDITYLHLYGIFGMDRSEFAAVIIGLRLCYYVANLSLLPLLLITARFRIRTVVKQNEEAL